ncbi:carboxymuconolactone decarboxylase family protein [Nonomuraea sp. NPDC050536]|uniref:carboxymuconolactone decarboxylase family protein n=1 Tax=Nonomuraea sp. NPDC050536 TaxID=3364366 RepID=UPI0037C9E1C6
MTQRMEIGKLVPEAYRAMAALDRFATQSTLPKGLLDLVRLRASQLNGCVYCVDMHSTDLKDAGEADNRLHALTVWQEAPFFTDKERAALALTEAATKLTTDDVTDEVWDRAAEHFSEQELATLIVAIATINAWNRIAVPTRMTPESYK